MVGAVRAHPALATLVVGGGVLAAANATVPDNPVVRFATDAMFLGGVLGIVLGGTGAITRGSGTTTAVGAAMLGASIIGQVVRRTGE